MPLRKPDARALIWDNVAHEKTFVGGGAHQNERRAAAKANLVFGNLEGIRRGRGRRKEKKWTDRAQSDIWAFGITGGWSAAAFKAEVWVETVTEGGWSFMDAWRKEEVDAARHRQEKRGNETGKVVITHGSVELCEATPIGLADESKESLYGRETDRGLRSAQVCMVFILFSPNEQRVCGGRGCAARLFLL